MGPDTTQRVPLGDAFATPEAKRRYNRRMFGIIAPRYDLITRLLSYGLDQRWKARLVERAGDCRGRRALDLACGTGDLALAVSARGATVLGLDLTQAMLRLAARKPGGRRVAWVLADMSHLPVGSASVDLVTVSYGLRNVARLDEALREIARVLRPGGRLLSLDFNRPAGTLLRETYLAYLAVVGSLLGLVLHGDADTYRYIAASLRRYPGAPAVAERMRACGLADATWEPLLGGLMALHAATKG
jgi:demethylmenaquinone methyltransferase/2-methoxy-6-polyprenyl-1,4-benzoquinol methylase